MIKNGGQYAVIGLGLLFIVVAVKLMFQDYIAPKDVVAIVMGLVLGIPMLFGSIFIIRKKEDLK